MESATVSKMALITSLLAVAAVGWVLTGERMVGMDHGPGTELGGLEWFMVSWVLMMAGMMLPALAPAAVSHARARFGAVPAFVVGYLGVWTAAGLAGYVIVEGVRSLELGFLAWDQFTQAATSTRIAVAASERCRSENWPAKGRIAASRPSPTRCDSGKWRALVRLKIRLPNR